MQLDAPDRDEKASRLLASDLRAQLLKKSFDKMDVVRTKLACMSLVSAHGGSAVASVAVSASECEAVYNAAAVDAYQAKWIDAGRCCCCCCCCCNGGKQRRQ